MKRRARALLTVLALSLSGAVTLPAQQLSPAGITRPTEVRRLGVARLEAPMIAIPAPATSPWPYIIVGAFVGGVATVAVVSWSIEQSGQECICSPMGFAPIVVGGAVLGGTAGYIVYRVRL